MQVANQMLFADAQEPKIQNFWLSLEEIVIKGWQKEQQTKIEKKLEATTKKLQEIHKSVSKRITIVEEKVLNLERTVDTKVINLEKTVDGNHRRDKKPSFDGSPPLSVFKLLFETVAIRNEWDDEEKALEQILALKGVAAEILDRDLPRKPLARFILHK